MADYVCPCCKCVTIDGTSLGPCYCDYDDCPRCKEPREES